MSRASSPMAVPSRTMADMASLAPEGEPTPGAARTRWLQVDGVARRFVVRLPTQSAGPIPVVLMFHGTTSYPEEQLALTGMGPKADAHGMALVLPEALRRVWNVPRDSARPSDDAFVAAILDECAARFELGPVFATGFSGGGRVACHLAEALPGRIAAIAPVAGLRAPGPRADRIPVLAMHGLRDPISPYAGGGSPVWTYGVDHAARGWARHLGCERVDRHQRGDMVRIHHSGPGASLTLERFQLLGHQWPGSPVDIGPDFGPAEPDYDASGRILAFFDAHRRPPP